MKKLNNYGYSLIELLVAVAIISILTAVASISVISILKSGKESSYKIMVSNIVTASKSLYEEIYSNELLNDTESKLYKYVTVGEPDTYGKTSNEITISSNSITVNLQTLVSNGYLSGTTNPNTSKESGNQNKKIIQNPKLDNKDDIGSCVITITRNVSTSNVVTYKIKPVTTNSICPTENEYSNWGN